MISIIINLSKIAASELRPILAKLLDGGILTNEEWQVLKDAGLIDRIPTKRKKLKLPDHG